MNTSNGHRRNASTAERRSDPARRLLFRLTRGAPGCHSSEWERPSFSCTPWVLMARPRAR